LQFFNCNLVLVDISWEDEIFFDYFGDQEFSLWQKKLLLVWSIAICCVKVAQFVHTLASTWLAYFLNHHLLIPPLEIGAQPTQMPIRCNQKTPIEFCGVCCFFSQIYSSNRSHPFTSTYDSFHVMTSLLNKQIVVCGSGQECGMECTRDC
jgi:cytochrome c oxidase subunit IV